MENLITVNNTKDILKIGEIIIETGISTYNGTNVREYQIKSKFKKIISITLTPVVTYSDVGTPLDNVMLQVLHDWDIVNNKIRLYVKERQSLILTIIGI